MGANASDAVLESAFEWLCQRRKDYSHNDGVWELRFRWQQVKSELKDALNSGRYRFSPLRRVRRREDVLEIWSARDALVLKAIAVVLSRHLIPELSSRCFHLAGNGGAKAAASEVVDHLDGNPFVFRTDVKNYYASLDHDILMRQFQRRFDDPRLLDLLSQYLRRTVYDDGLYEDVTRGISLGCPLSPLVGALFLDELDQRMEKLGVFYVRFMDDWVILAPSRWKLRNAIRVVNQTLAELKVEQHPDKTFIGRVERGFTFLGYHLNSQGLVGVAPSTKARFVERVTRLYEQGAPQTRIGDYVRRWLTWVRSGMRFANSTIEWVSDCVAFAEQQTQRILQSTTSQG